MVSIDSSAKHNRILDLCIRFLDGEIICKKDEAIRYQLNERSIQRDIDDLRAFFFSQGKESGFRQELIYDRSQRGYRLNTNNKVGLSDSEALAVCKILLESRAFAKEEMETIIDKIIKGCVPKQNSKQITDFISNEEFYYIEPNHRRRIIDNIWEISNAIKSQKLMEIDYVRQDGSVVQRLIKPVGLMFSEYYFYLTAFIKNEENERNVKSNNKSQFPAIFRIDRITNYRVLREGFDVHYKNRFQEGEFRKRVQFMYGGELQYIKFEYTGFSIESVLDRIPTAVVESNENGKFVICAEVFGSGVEMWLRTQGSMVKLLEPQEMVRKFTEEINLMKQLYDEEE